MVLEKEHIKTYLDDNLILEFDDSSEKSGNINLISWGLETHFDNVIITGADIPDGGSLKSVDAKRKLTTTWSNIKSK